MSKKIIKILQEEKEPITGIITILYGSGKSNESVDLITIENVKQEVLKKYKDPFDFSIEIESDIEHRAYYSDDLYSEISSISLWFKHYGEL